MNGKYVGFVDNSNNSIYTNETIKGINAILKSLMDEAEFRKYKSKFATYRDEQYSQGKNFKAAFLWFFENVKIVPNFNGRYQIHIGGNKTLIGEADILLITKKGVSREGEPEFDFTEKSYDYNIYQNMIHVYQYTRIVAKNEDMKFLDVRYCMENIDDLGDKEHLWYLQRIRVLI